MVDAPHRSCRSHSRYNGHFITTDKILATVRLGVLVVPNWHMYVCMMMMMI